MCLCMFCVLCVQMATSKGLLLSWFVEPAIPPLLMLDSTRRQCARIKQSAQALRAMHDRGPETNYFLSHCAHLCSVQQVLVRAAIIPMLSAFVLLAADELICACCAACAACA